MKILIGVVILVGGYYACYAMDSSDQSPHSDSLEPGSWIKMSSSNFENMRDWGPSRSEMTASELQPLLSSSQQQSESPLSSSSVSMNDTNETPEGSPSKDGHQQHDNQQPRSVRRRYTSGFNGSMLLTCCGLKSFCSFMLCVR